MLHDMQPVKYRTLESREEDCGDHPQTRLCSLYYFINQYIKINIIFNERSMLRSFLVSYSILLNIILCIGIFKFNQKALKKTLR